VFGGLENKRGHPQWKEKIDFEKKVQKLVIDWI
jgi:hypothetical protein